MRACPHQEVVVEEALVVAAVPAELVEAAEAVAAGLHALHGRGALVAAALGLGRHARLQGLEAAADLGRGSSLLLQAQEGLQHELHGLRGPVLRCPRAGRRK